MPTKRRVKPNSVSFAAPTGLIELSSLVDEDAEAVKAKAQEEKREEREMESMKGHDRPTEVKHEVQFGDGRIFDEEINEQNMEIAHAPQSVLETYGPRRPVGFATKPEAQTGLTHSSSATVAMQADPGLSAPITPQDTPSSPRHGPQHFVHEVEHEDSVPKRSKTEDHKKQKINFLSAENEKMVRAVKFGTEQYHTMDDYGTELGEVVDEDVWVGEDELYFAGVPEELWSDCDLKEQPLQPDEWVDKLADQVEISRLVEMKVLVEEKDFKGEIHGKLTTKMVRDWRRKLYVCDGQSRERWMRRSRLVAREYAIEKRDDCYSPATGAHTANLLPVLYLMQQAEAEGMSSDYEPTLCSLDIKDAFLQVPQREPIRVYLDNVPYIIPRNLPGQRQGSREWYWHFRQFLTDELGFQWCDIQPCLAKTKDATILLHVDDVLFCGNSNYFHNVFLKKCQSKFSANYNVLGEVGPSISFLKKRMVKVQWGHTLGSWHKS